MIFPARFRLILLSLTSFALGVGLTTAWFLVRETPISGPKPLGESGARPQASATTQDEGRPAKPWKTKGIRKSGEGALPETPHANPEPVAESPSIRTELRHQIRVKALEMTYRLGLDARQSATLQAEVESILDIAPGVIDHKTNPESTAAALVRRELVEILNAEQIQELSRSTGDPWREEAAQRAMESIADISRVVHLRDEQRWMLLQGLTVVYHPDGSGFVPSVESGDLLHYGEPIEMEAMTPGGAAPVVIKESRIEPVGPDIDPIDLILAETLTLDPLAEILMDDQLATYRAFQRERRKLEKLRDEESRTMEKE